MQKLHKELFQITHWVRTTDVEVPADWNWKPTFSSPVESSWSLFDLLGVSIEYGIEGFLFGMVGLFYQKNNGISQILTT
jgi:hypothetical protein